MKNLLFLCIAIILFHNCNENRDITVKVDKTIVEFKNIVVEDSIILPENNEKLNISHPIVLKEFLKRLINDNYKVDSINLKTTDFYSFSRNGVSIDTLQSLKILNVNSILYKVKRRIPTEKNGNTYSRFTVSEFSFHNENESIRMKSKLDSIIDCIGRIDLRNEKKYDFLVQYSNRLIYVNCNSMYLSSYSNKYKSVIENIKNDLTSNESR